MSTDLKVRRRSVVGTAAAAILSHQDKNSTVLEEFGPREWYLSRGGRSSSSQSRNFEKDIRVRARYRSGQQPRTEPLSVRY
jgi:hypothetical protein